MKRLFNLFLKENPSMRHFVNVLSVLDTFHRWLVIRRKTTRHTNDWPNKFMVRKWVNQIQGQ